MSQDEEVPSRRPERAWIAAALALIVVAGVAVGVLTRWGRGDESSSSPSEPQRRGTELVIAVGDVAGGEFDPLKGWGSRPAQIRPIHSSLLTIDADVDFVGDLASEYSVSDDARTWSFTLRDKARWSNGEPVTARDVVFTYETLKQDGTRFDLTFVDRITATDASRVEFHLKEPRSTFVSQLSEIPILPAAHYGPDYSKNPIGPARTPSPTTSRGSSSSSRRTPTGTAGGRSSPSSPSSSSARTRPSPPPGPGPPTSPTSLRPSPTSASPA